METKTKTGGAPEKNTNKSFHQADYANNILSSVDCVTINNLAKDYKGKVYSDKEDALSEDFIEEVASAAGFDLSLNKAVITDYGTLNVCGKEYGFGGCNNEFEETQNLFLFFKRM